jgi:hypothetical protein
LEQSPRGAKLDATCESQTRPLDLFVPTGQVSDHIGARALLSGLRNVKWLLGGGGYDANWLGEALQDKGVRACIPGQKQRKKTVKYLFRSISAQCPAGQWTSADTNGACPLQSVRQAEGLAARHKRYDCCPKVFLCAIAIAATVI